MTRQNHDAGGGAVENFDEQHLETRLREAARAVSPDRLVDDLEVRHLSRVVTGCSLLLTDVYSDQRLARIMESDRGVLGALVGRLIEEERSGRGEALYRVRRLPDDVRVVGDKALFDAGLLGLRRVRGFDLADLGARAYLAASETLRLLAEDRRLRDFFRQNKILMLPVEQEVEFLKQCSDRFPLYAGILRKMGSASEPPTLVESLTRTIPIMKAVEEVFVAEAGPVPGPSPALAEAARGDEGAGSLLSRNELLSAYERMVLFAALDMGEIRQALDATVIDQPRAVEALCDEFSLFASGTRDLRKPPAFFLVGPTGVGKNHLVESLCRLLEGIWRLDVPVLVIEGPNYTYPSDINELRGATRGFIRSDEDGLLTQFHERSSRAPFSIILVDEVEKAHPQLSTFFLSILDRGTTTDNRGQVLNFANAMVFFTSNLGYSDGQQRAPAIGYGDEAARRAFAAREVHGDLRRALSPEFMNRVRMIHFERLARTSAERILDLEFEKIARRYREVHDLGLELDGTAREELLVRGFSPLFGARHLAATLENVCNVEIAKKIRRDDRRGATDRAQIVAWLRELREGGRAFDPDEVRRRVHGHVRSDLAYQAVRIAFRDGEFSYVPVSGGDP